MRRVIRGVVVAALLWPASCAVLGPEIPLQVVLPPAPAHWRRAFPDLRYALVYPDSAGWVQTDVADGSPPVTISCLRSANTPVLAFPRPGAGGAAEGLLRPAGGLYPSSLDPRRGASQLILRWEDGPVACVTARLEAQGRDVSLLNTARLSSLFATVADAWDLDLDAVATRLARGDFAAHDAAPLPGRDVRVICGPGDWFLESPFSTVVASGPDGSVLLERVTLGLHGLFAANGRRALLEVSGQETCLLPLP